MTPRTTPPFRADHVGSLLRPAELHEARTKFAEGSITADQLRAVEDEAIRGVVELQRAAGLQSATDGEFRRASWHMDFIYQLGGIGKSEEQLHVKFHNAAGDIEFNPAGLKVHDKVRLDGVIFGQHFEFLKSIVDGRITPKQTIPSPSMVYYRGGRAAVSESVYPDLEEFYEDLAAAYAKEIAGMAALGCTYLQLDDTSLAYLNDPEQRALVAKMGGDPDKQHVRNIKTMNAALAGRPEGLTVTTHLCRGNFRSSWVAQGGYDFVADALFNELNVDGYFLEFDDERSGGFEPLRFVPKGKYVVLGLVTTKRGELESVDSLRRRIEGASQYVDVEQLCLSPQCGFSSTEEGNDLTQDQQKAKLERIVETAASVWG
ncbi:5-methyltetrahydropteroyltriglutamate--homocysteine methyltransferase [Amycolatopsis bartoniae]|uniref:5-methyltetrahydropteroyltriglutamate--homocysteine S-methyltransferase n=1 Tax=Amycolatopsis bartoniae TaxID=941986 RepID=A0A8H9ISX9_9PSEU|nr:5-methyltetrahydropteroyltriglutamate--homocysteine S-methyltransferase [Amycolatopsis bartoniae]MBB2935260.1 5-methyltetrahydropteroyltriglutamate--homocysteine methyltransferase [Amycolatopsis bartoniae]TVT06829.1 5-methyltetrahydropteroyltriglutamate--homocysteine S-methyltransferase [Amycolatopsis bartoniae]GHF55565.1 5-methyltetrahydropteroyltriglutamate--homocysteine S-methyltransferase [Amycolatopsis bartoniae]